MAKKKTDKKNKPCWRCKSTIRDKHGNCPNKCGPESLARLLRFR
jgi:hypothetical protein